MIGVYISKPEAIQKRFISDLEKAKKEIVNYPKLNELFQNFNNYERYSYTTQRKNIIFNFCTRIGNNEYSNYFKTKLKTIDDAITTLKPEENELRLRMKNTNQNHSIITELEFAYFLRNKIKNVTINLWPKLTNGKKSDIILKSAGKEVYFEVGNLEDSKTQKKINQILTAVAKQVGERSDKIGHIRIIVDTAYFIRSEEGYIAEIKSEKKLISEINKLKLWELSGKQGHFCRNDLDESINQIIKHVIIVDAQRCWTVIEVESSNSFPGESCGLSHTAWLKRIKVKIESQINEEKQIELNKPNVIVIKAPNVNVFELGLASQTFRNDLKKKIMELFNAIQKKNLSGVIVYGECLEESSFFENPFAAKTSKLEKEVINNLGFKN